MTLLKSFFFYAFILVSGNCFSQYKLEKDDSLLFEKTHTVSISLHHDSIQQKKLLPFSDIDIIDARFDTSLAGFYQTPHNFSHINFTTP